MVDVSDLLGIRYMEHGRGKEGYDCYGLAMEVMRRYGAHLPDFDYESHTDKFFAESVVAALRLLGSRVIKVDNLVEGAMVLFGNEAGMSVHIGVYIGDGNIIHCNKRGVRIDRAEAIGDDITGVYVWRG